VLDGLATAIAQTRVGPGPVPHGLANYPGEWEQGVLTAALRDIRSPTVLWAFYRTSETPAPVRARLAIALGLAGELDIIPDLARLVTTDPDPFVRAHAAEALGEYGVTRTMTAADMPPEAMSALRAAFSDPSFRLWVPSLGEPYGSPAVPGSLVRGKAWQALTELGCELLWLGWDQFRVLDPQMDFSEVPPRWEQELRPLNRALWGFHATTVHFDPNTATGTIVIHAGEETQISATLQVGSTTASVNDKPYEMPAPTVVIDGEVAAPLGFLCDLFSGAIVPISDTQPAM